MATELSKITIYTVSRHLKQPFGEDLKENDYRYISSIKEKKCFKFCSKEYSEKFTTHTKRELVRIYPDGSRVDSSNYSPIKPWACGCQIVALNYQTECEEMLINQAKFRPFGNTGFALKPKFLRADYTGQPFDQNERSTWPPDCQKQTVFKIGLG